jgi:hypothetical protein
VLLLSENKKTKKENVSALLLAADLFCFLSLSFFCVFFYLSLLKQPSSRLLSCPKQKQNKTPLHLCLISGPARHRLVTTL